MGASSPAGEGGKAPAPVGIYRAIDPEAYSASMGGSELGARYFLPRVAWAGVPVVVVADDPVSPYMMCGAPAPAPIKRKSKPRACLLVWSPLYYSA